MSLSPESSADRLPLPADDQLTEAQRAAIERIAAGPRGGIIGPFIALLRAPELMTRVQLLGEYLRFDSSADDDLIELVILQIARHWDQQFEWGFHQPVARSKGLPVDVIAAIAERRRPTGGRPEVLVVWDLVDELLRTTTVGGDLYAKARELLGETQLVELVATAGYYTTLAMVMNVARTPPPAGAPRLPEVPGTQI